MKVRIQDAYIPHPKHAVVSCPWRDSAGLLQCRNQGSQLCAKRMQREADDVKITAIYPADKLSRRALYAISACLAHRLTCEHRGHVSACREPCDGTEWFRTQQIPNSFRSQALQCISSRQIERALWTFICKGCRRLGPAAHGLFV